MGITQIQCSLEEALGIPTVKQFGSLAHHVSSQDGQWIETGSETTQTLDEITGKLVIIQRTTVEWQGEWYVVYGDTPMRDIAILQKQDDGTYQISGDEAVIALLTKAQPKEKPAIDLATVILAPTKDQVISTSSMGRATFSKLAVKPIAVKERIE